MGNDEPIHGYNQGTSQQLADGVGSEESWVDGKDFAGDAVQFCLCLYFSLLLNKFPAILQIFIKR